MVEERERERQARTFGPTDVVALVAIDLLWLDGQPLFDVPLLERKRLLESVAGRVRLIRRGQFVRPPIDTWIGSWRAARLRRAITFKSANGATVPGPRPPTTGRSPRCRRADSTRGRPARQAGERDGTVGSCPNQP